MPRKPLIYSDLFPYHVTNRSNNKEWFYIPPLWAWEVFCSVLGESTCKYHVQVHAFVLLSNHYHMVLSTPRANIDAFMRYFQTQVCRGIQKRAARINHVFGSRYKWSVLEDAFAVMCAYKYVLRNPVRAGMVSRVEDYAFSSLRSMLRLTNALPITERIDPLFSSVPRPITGRLDWLNKPTSKEVEEVVGKALRRFEFALTRGNDLRARVEAIKENYGAENIPATYSAEK